MKADQQQYWAAKSELMRFAQKIGDTEQLENSSKIGEFDSLVDRLIENAVKLAFAGETFAARRILVDEVAPAQRGQLAAIDSLIKKNVLTSAQQLVAARSDYDKNRTLIVTITLVAFALALAVGYVVTRSIVSPLCSAVDLAIRVSNKDLTISIANDRTDETGLLLTSLTNMADSLTGVVSSVKQCTGQLVVSAEEISAGNCDFCDRTERQANSLCQTAGSMEKLANFAHANAESAQKAQITTTQVVENAREGRRVVQQINGKMVHMTAVITKISDIVGIIDTIAFQTNVLALNAAVEAARTGKNGSGFLIVSTEVRTLAERCAAAAKIVKKLVEETRRLTKDGQASVSVAGDKIAEMLASLEGLTETVSEIALASAQQSERIQQVNASTILINAVVKQNSAQSLTVATLARHMNDQVASLADQVEIFKIARPRSTAQAAE